MGFIWHPAVIERPAKDTQPQAAEAPGMPGTSWGSNVY